MNTSDHTTVWHRWMRHPQSTWLRKAIFQIHLWSGIGVGLYVLFVSVTGSVLVWRNELAAAATRGDQSDSVPLGLKAVNKLLDLHDDLLGGSTGRRINGIGALLLVVLSFTGIVIWWPGIKRWRRSLTVHRDVGWRRFCWDVHSMIGFWGFVVIAMFGLSGAYLCYPEPFQNLADWLEPLTQANAGIRIGDKVIYWLAYLHFGRIGGIGIPCTVRSGLCDFATKSVWAALGLLPAAMFVTGTLMWWNRVVRTKIR